MNISIIGGGIGGLATANALLKKGFNVQVYERAQALRPIGAGLSLTPNGLNSLNAIQPQIVEALKQAGSQANTLTLKRSTGEAIASKQITLMQQYGQPMLNIQWSRLQAILASTLPPDIHPSQSSLKAYERRRIPRTEAIYIRSANQGDRSYKPDNETTFREMMNNSQMNQDDFQDWLYSYKPS